MGNFKGRKSTVLDNLANAYAAEGGLVVELRREATRTKFSRCGKHSVWGLGHQLLRLYANTNQAAIDHGAAMHTVVTNGAQLHTCDGCICIAIDIFGELQSSIQRHVSYTRKDLCSKCRHLTRNKSGAFTSCTKMVHISCCLHCVFFMERKQN